jgi:hypothetical protein
MCVPVQNVGNCIQDLSLSVSFFSRQQPSHQSCSSTHTADMSCLLLAISYPCSINMSLLCLNAGLLHADIFQLFCAELSGSNRTSITVSSSTSMSYLESCYLVLLFNMLLYSHTEGFTIKMPRWWLAIYNVCFSPKQKKSLFFFSCSYFQLCSRLSHTHTIFPVAIMLLVFHLASFTTVSSLFCVYAFMMRLWWGLFSVPPDLLPWCEYASMCTCAWLPSHGSFSFFFFLSHCALSCMSRSHKVDGSIWETFLMSAWGPTFLLIILAIRSHQKPTPAWLIYQMIWFSEYKPHLYFAQLYYSNAQSEMIYTWPKT